jgi:hypothetical protein
MSAPLDGGAVVTLALGQDTAGAIAVAGASVYWVDSAASGQLMTLAATDLQTDPDNCGGCGDVCGGGGCDGGNCVCDLDGGARNFCPSEPGTTNEGVCSSLETDPQNCGGCGLACIASFPSTTSGCEACQCLVMLAREQAGATSIAVDGQRAYWVVPGGVITTFLTGGAPDETVSGGTPRSLATAPTGIYWTDNDAGAVLEGSAIGGDEFYTLASNQSNPWGIAVDATRVYWTNNTDAGTVMSVLLDGGGLATLASGQDQPSAIAVDFTRAYWTDQGAGTVMAVSLTDGGSPTALATGQLAPSAIAVDSTSVYWTNAAGGTVMSVPLDGGSPVTLASGQAQPFSILVDATRVYWADSSGAVMSVPLDGGSATTLETGQFPGGIAIDANRLYWTNQADGGTVWSLSPKTGSCGGG